MARLFDITTTSDTASTKAGDTVKLVFTVTNIAQRPLRGSLRAKALDSGQAPWLAIGGDAERDFPPGLAHQVEVSAKVPAGTAAGKFRVRLDALSVVNPDDDFTEGPAVSVTIVAAETPSPKKSLWWLWLIIGIVVLLLIGLVAWLAMRKTSDSQPPEPPASAPPTVKTADVPKTLIGQEFAPAKKALEMIGFTVSRENKNITEGCAEKVLSSNPAPGASGIIGSPVVLTVSNLPYGPATCKMGFVWREAFPGDSVCVTGESRAQAAQDNAQQAARSELVPATAKDFEQIQREVPQSRAVPKGDFLALRPFAAERLVINSAQPAMMLISRCKGDYTERRARAQDRVCVTVATQLATDAENQQAENRKACSTK